MGFTVPDKQTSAPCAEKPAAQDSAQESRSIVVRLALYIANPIISFVRFMNEAAAAHHYFYGGQYAADCWRLQRKYIEWVIEIERKKNADQIEALTPTAHGNQDLQGKVTKPN